MKLYEISWGIYPRRVGVYLAEKGIADIERIDMPVGPEMQIPILGDMTIPGSVPALDIGNGRVIGGSIAIIEYLEEIYPTPNLMGETPVERSLTREVISAIEEATIHYGVWVYHGSPLFAGMFPQVPQAAEQAIIYFNKFMQRLDKYAATSTGEFLAGDKVTIADCVTFSAIQFMIEVYSVPIPDGCPNLEAWFERFSKRPCAKKPDYPASVLSVTQGLPAHTQAALAKA